MGKILIIAEKDSLGKQIAKALNVTKKVKDCGSYYYESDRYVIGMAAGHLLSLVPCEAFSQLPYLPSKFDIQPIPSKLTKLMLLKKLGKRTDIDEICNACDPGREGELICYLIYKFIGVKKKYTRLWANTQTPSGILKDFSNRRSETDYKYLLQAALARAEADFKIGINATKCLLELMNKTKGNSLLFSAGRVKTPTIALIYDLEQRIINFKPKNFYEVHAKLVDNQGSTLLVYRKRVNPLGSKDVTLNTDRDDLNTSLDILAKDDRIYDKYIATQIKENCLQIPVQLKFEVLTRPQREAPPPLFDITDLIAAANRQYQFPVETITKDLQELYEKGFVTYPRSESQYLGNDAVSHIIDVFKFLSKINTTANAVLENNWIQSDNAVFNTEKLIDGHGAIIPDIPGSDCDINILTENQRKLYQLIVERLITRFYPDALYNVKVYVIKINNEAFEATSKNCIELGWKSLKSLAESDIKIENEKTCINDFNLNEANLAEVEVISKLTTPPKRVALGELPKLMKYYHLGTAATRASIINDLLANKDKRRVSYIQIKNNLVYPTEEAKFVIQFLRKHNIQSITQSELTANWEQQLKKISEGKFKSTEFIASINQETCNIVQKFEDHLKVIPEYKVSVGNCPKCQSELFDTGKKLIECECDFKIWKTQYGVELTSKQISSLLDPKSDFMTDPITGFIGSKSNRKFDASLKLDSEQNWKVVPQFTNKNETNFLCPLCGNKLNLFVNESKFLFCSSRSHKFQLHLKVAGRVFSENEISNLLKDRYLSNRAGFINKQGNAFEAALELLPEGKVKFLFAAKK
jgi:DNA topoisomerase III